MPPTQKMRILHTLIVLILITSCSSMKKNSEQTIIVENYEIKSEPALLIDSHAIENDLIHRINEIKKIPFKTTSFKNNKLDSIDKNCGDSLYWDIVKLGEAAIPQLISKIQDETKTSIQVQCRDTNLNVGTVAFMILDEIIAIPYFLVFQTQWDVLNVNCDYGYPIGLLEYVNTYPQEAQEKLTKWYQKYGKKIKKEKLSLPNQNECQKAFGIDYKLKIDY